MFPLVILLFARSVYFLDTAERVGLCRRHYWTQISPLSIVLCCKEGLDNTLQYYLTVLSRYSQPSGAHPGQGYSASGDEIFAEGAGSALQPG
jgi:hypothetical protein